MIIKNDLRELNLEKSLNAHSLEIDEVAEILQTSIDNGLSELEAQRRLEKYGKNQLIEHKKLSPFQIFLKQFKNFLVYLLFFAIIITLGIGFYKLYTGKPPEEFIDSIVIFIILIINAILGFYQEYNAEKVLESLKRMAPHSAKVKRNGIIKEIDVEDVVPGDIILLDEGDKVPADARLIKGFSLSVDESLLTGESRPVHKISNIIKKKSMLADRKNILYSNTIITRGHGEAIVISTGMNTEVGKIAEKIQIEVEPSPFQQDVDRFGKKLGIIIVIVCFALFIVELIQLILFPPSSDIDVGIEIINILNISISLAVSAVPEGLVIVITVVMSIGMKKIAKRNALVKTLNVVETLGRVNVICSDKTGTLTKNEMTVVKIFVDNKILEVEGVGYNIIGRILENGNEVKITPSLKRFLETCLFCNNSIVNILDESKGEVSVVGDPTEISLKVLALKAKLDYEFEKLDEIPFNSDRKMMTVIGKREGKMIAFIKGAPDVLMKNASKILINGEQKPIDDMRDAILKQNEDFARSALRVLGIAYKELDDNYDINTVEKDFCYIGLAGIIDPPRDEVRYAIKEAKDAGIRTIMITGDHKITAIAIAKAIGLTENEEAITGVELEEMSDDDLYEQIKSVNVFARVTSEHKLRILNILKADGNIVCMTGDGVNDAPAVKGANVGVAMGLKGTEVTQEAADLILLDDNYATIVSAIEEGRGIFNITKGFFRYMLSVNFSEIFLIFVAWILIKSFVNIFLAQPLEPIQILWLNIATDGIPAMVLGFTPAEPNLMKKPPRKDFNLISDIKKSLILTASIAAISSIILYIVLWTILIPMWSNPNSFWFDSRLIEGTILFGKEYSGKEYSIAISQTIIFTNVVFFELFFVFSCTSETNSMWTFPNKHLFWATGLSFSLHLIILYTPLGIAFHSVPLDKWYYWIIILLSSFIIIPAEEIRKYFLRKKD
ncbi:MAG: cation-translocating P-type ATPase [Candidatus Helarchaeota archaeon]